MAVFLSMCLPHKGIQVNTGDLCFGHSGLEFTKLVLLHFTVCPSYRGETISFLSAEDVSSPSLPQLPFGSP